MGRDGKVDLTQLLANVNSGREGAYDDLAAAVYDDLRAMAQRRLARKFGPGLGGLTIQPTALATDTFLKLIRQRKEYDSSGHFFAIASLAMRRVLLDYCRSRAVRPTCVALDSENATARDVDIVALYDLLDQLAGLDARKASVVQYRVFWGLTIPEIAEALDVGHATVERDWAFAKVWLAKELAGPQP